ncbi:hypothetical protein ACFU98_38485 [Streptomyces sp. NPDC057575]|uniref:hypothetical protein n=1 Tax=unclassified Streptomyces TaxID=2593676 RepID=UPI0036840D4B
MAQATRKDAHEAETRARREAEITRIIAMRTTTRLWRNHLAQTIIAFELGLPVDRASFDEAVTPARNAAQSALDHALHDGIWVKQTNYGTPFRDSDDGEIRVMNALNRLTELMRSELVHLDVIRTAGLGENVPPLNTRQVEALKRALDDVDTARGELSATLLNRLERTMNVSVIGGAAPARRLPGISGTQAIDASGRTDATGDGANRD